MGKACVIVCFLRIFFAKVQQTTHTAYQVFFIKILGAAHRNICSKIGKIRFEGAAHRDICRDINLILRCAAPSKRGKFTISTNIAVRCTFLHAPHTPYRLLPILIFHHQYFATLHLSLCPYPKAVITSGQLVDRNGMLSFGDIGQAKHRFTFGIVQG
jgi:hypothetical protein